MVPGADDKDKAIEMATSCGFTSQKKATPALRAFNSMDALKKQSNLIADLENKLGHQQDRLDNLMK